MRTNSIRAARSPYTLGVLAAAALQMGTPAQAAPTSGAYVTDAQNTWVQDRVGDRISTVNMIMCVMSSLRPDAMVNQGAYVALVDKNKCEGRGDSSKSGSSSAGASNATDYMSGVVVSTQDSETEPLIVKAWLHQEEDMGGGPQKVTIYAYIVATEGVSDAHPNGLFSMYFCGVPDGMNSCMFSGSLKSDASGISFYESDGGGGGGEVTALRLVSNPAADSGYGRIATSGGMSPPSDFTFAYDSSIFHRSDGNGPACFSRDDANANYSTWRYGVYHADGSRLDLAHPGFPVKYTHGGDTYYGYWSFWGLWLPESAMATLGSSGQLTRRVGDTDVPLSIVKKGGRLWKLTRQAATLENFKNVPMMFWAQNNVGTSPNQLLAGNNYELQWDGSVLKAVGMQVCSGNQCSPQALGSPITLHASDFVAAGFSALPVFFPSGGGSGAVLVPPSGDFYAVRNSQSVYFRTRDVVAPSDVNAPSALHCVSGCPKSGSALVASFGSSPVTPFLTGTWGPNSTKTDYGFTAGMLVGAGGNVDASSVDRSTMEQYQWGVTSGSMVAPDALDSVRCDVDGTPNTAGSYYCPDLVDKATVVYQWETGPNQWNQYFGASGVTIDPPKQLAFTATLSNVRAADPTRYAGSTLQLQFNGFGELQGIPGSCVDPDTNAPIACDQNTRWVPAFDIVDGSTLSDGSATYYVKFLEREMRLGNTSCASAPSLVGAAAMTLPSASLVDVNSMTTNGPEPTPANPKPAVIHGIVQSGS